VAQRRRRGYLVHVPRAQPSSAPPLPSFQWPAALAGTLATAVTMLTLDLGWLGLVASKLYASALGDLQRPDPYLPAAALFYAMYLVVTVAFAVWPARSPLDAARRGAGLGFACYATYELTNWAVLRGWPGWLVPIDLAWGVALTGVASTVGFLAWRAASKRSA
jgi:uncharacterized membrane protein